MRCFAVFEPCFGISGLIGNDVSGCPIMSAILILLGSSSLHISLLPAAKCGVLRVFAVFEPIFMGFWDWLDE